MNPWFWGLVFLLMMGGIATSITNISANTLIQASTHEHFRGQAVSLYMLALRGGLSIGSLLTGISVSISGVSHAFLINGLLAMVAQLLVGRVWFRR